MLNEDNEVIIVYSEYTIVLAYLIQLSIAKGFMASR